MFFLPALLVFGISGSLEMRGWFADFCSASSLGMMSDEEKRHQRVEDIKDLLS